QSSEYANSADNDRYTNGYDGGDDGGSDDEFMCDSGETIPWDWVNDGYDDCEDGSDEWDDGGSGDEFMCDSGETIPWDWVNDGVDDCQDGSDEWDDGPGVEEFHFYDNCTDDNGTYECWMDEWDYDNDGEFDESHGFDYADCSLESNGSWKCFVGYDDEWDDSEEINTYYCLPFVNYNAEGFSIFNITNLDSSTCGELVEDVMYEFDLNETWTMPTHLIWEDCWIEGNETICEQGEIYYDVNTTMLWETTHENNYMDCDGDYDNNTSMCTEWIGNVTESDGSAFLVVNDYEESLMMYQYDESTHSGLIIFVQSESDEDGEWSFDRELQDCDSDGDMMVSYSELEACIDVDLYNDGFDSLNASLVGAYEVFNMTDMDNDGMLNESEFNELNVFLSNDDDDDMNLDDMFDMLDIDSDGEVTASEWAEMSNQSGEEEMSEEDFDNLSMMIDMFDDDYSGGLNFEEFVNMMENMDDMGDDDNDMDPETMFDMFDANGDGEVTASEWFDFTNQTDEPMSEEDFGYLSAMMDNYDVDDSGGLDFDEFMTFMSEMEDMEDSEPDVAMFMAFGLLDFAGADVNDYMVELAMCEGESLLDLECEDSVYSRVLADIMYSSEEEAMMALMTDSMVFMDSDGSGTLTNGDFVMINKDNLDVDGEWNFARLHSTEAGAYSDENPMMGMLPGFTGFIATIGLLGAALIRRE
ncbi:MAG: EF-hand domain-containing protein, partial [Candidatus Poseidoniaceae archaeon]